MTYRIEDNSYDEVNLSDDLGFCFETELIDKDGDSKFELLGVLSDTREDVASASINLLSNHLTTNRHAKDIKIDDGVYKVVESCDWDTVLATYNVKDVGYGLYEFSKVEDEDEDDDVIDLFPNQYDYAK